MRESGILARRTVAAALFGIASWHAASATAADPQKTIEPAIREQIATDQAAVASQQQLNELSDETRELLLKYRQYLTEAKNLGEYMKQLSVQVQSQTDEMKFVQKQLEEIEVTAREVMPLMQKMLDTLDRFVQLDLPFQPEERRKRVDSLKQVMGRADVSISEKYRRIIEADQIETEYGRTLEAYQGELGEGDAARTVRFLRIGRIALLFQTLDGKETGYWDTARKSWVVDDSYRSAVKHGFDVADKVGAPDLLRAPIPAPVSAPAEKRS